MAIGDILNFIQIDAATALGGQPTAAQFADARDAGYDLVINLAPDGLQTSLPDQAQLLASLGIDYAHIPVAWADPRREQLADFIALMEEAKGRRMLIHCQANFRVTAFYALYAMARLGWSRARAQALIDRVWTSRPGFTMDDRWRQFIAEAAGE
jgi:uncharacterized protein (TIGR01244 family)